MPRMFDLIRSSSVPATLMHSAARGALSVTPAEMIEILVHLANHNKVFGQQARMTLAGWEEKSSLEAASDPNSPKEVLDYLIAHENLRPCLLQALIENPSISEETLAATARHGSREVVEAMRWSPRVQSSRAILHALAENPNSNQQESSKLEELAAAEEALGASVTGDGSDSSAAAEDHAEDDAAFHAFLTEHAHELEMEGEKPFQPLGGIHEFEVIPPEEMPTIAVVEESLHVDERTGPESTPAPPSAGSATATRMSPAAKKAPATSPPEQRGSALQKIAKLDVKGRIQLAMKGSKEERSILVRDGTKLVALAVLDSGKITDGEVEKIAGQKNVLEAVLRQIPMKRRFIKNYNVVRNLVANPRTPLDVSLGLVKNLLVADLRNLSANKDVPDTIRKLALKMFKQKTDPNKKMQ
jgi:hypothetical protein